VRVRKLHEFRGGCLAFLRAVRFAGWVANKPLRLYLETSFWRRLADDASDLRRSASYRFLGQVRRHHEIVVSRLVYDELRFTTPAAQLAPVLRRLDASRSTLVPITAAVRALASELLLAGGWKERQRPDVTHLACAMIYGARALVTWDSADLAKPKTRDTAEKWARHNDRAPLRIGKPEDVASWLGIA